MKSTITGDIVRSKSVEDPEIWLRPLKTLFSTIGSTPKNWEIFRGDSFQLEADTSEILRIAILIKSIIKQVDSKTIDVRIAIGIGEDNKSADRVSESMGESFVFSGQLLDELKSKKIHLGLKSPWKKFDEEFNMLFKLALVIMNSWTKNTAEVVEMLFKIPDITQVEIADKLGLAQSTVNDRIKRGSVYEIIELEQYFRKKVESKNYPNTIY